MVATGLIWGHVLRIQPTQTVFVSTCLSLSSTPLVSRFLAGGSRGEKDGTDTSVLVTGARMLLNFQGSLYCSEHFCTVLCEGGVLCERRCCANGECDPFSCAPLPGELDYSSVLLGMLVMQDVQLSLLIAVMPSMIQAQSGDLGGSVHPPSVHTRVHTQPFLEWLVVFSKHSFLLGSLRILFLLGQVLISLAAVLLLCLLIKSFLIGPYYKKLHSESRGNKEILVLGIAAFVFFMLTVKPLHFTSHKKNASLRTWDLH